MSISGYIFHREGQELEFKEQFNFSSLADYFWDFAALSNNKGGYLVFGVQDSPKILNGLSVNTLDQFEKIDPEKITGFLLNIFSENTNWKQATFEIDQVHFGKWLQLWFATIAELYVGTNAKKAKNKARRMLTGQYLMMWQSRPENQKKN